MKAAKAFRGLTCILSLLLAISIGLTSGMFSAEGHINRFLGIETTVLVPKAEGVGQASSARYPSSFLRISPITRPRKRTPNPKPPMNSSSGRSRKVLFCCATTTMLCP